MSEAWLITGGSGFVGKTLLTRLLKSDQPPPVLRVLVRQPSDAPARVEPCVGDLREPLSLHRACEGVDTVIHLAGIAHVGSAASAEARAINIDGSLALLRAAIDAGARRFVFLSSTLSLDDSLHYGRDKRCVEEALIAAAAAGSIEVVVLRAVNIYGVGMRGNIATMIRLISSGALPRLHTLSNRLSLVGVDDVVSALLLAATHVSLNDSSAKLAIRVTLTDGCEYRINTIEEAIYTAVERRPSHWRLPAVVLFTASGLAELLEKLRIFRSGIGLRTYRNLTRDNLFDNQSARTELGFEPTTTFFEQLDTLVHRSE